MIYILQLNFFLESNFESILCLLNNNLSLHSYYNRKYFDFFYKKRELTASEIAYFENLEQFLNNINENNVSRKEIFDENSIICLSSLIENDPPINNKKILN